MLKEGFIDNQSQSHMFFQGLRPSYARSNVVQIKIGDGIIVDVCVVNANICQELDADLKKLSWKRYCYTFQMVKPLARMVLQMKCLKSMLPCLQSFTQIFQQYWDSGFMPESWKVGLIKSIPKVQSPE